MVDIFIGGFGDRRSLIVKSFVDAYRARRPDRSAVYFEHGQVADAIGFLRRFVRASPFHDTINLIGHSYGACSAVAIAAGFAQEIHTLIGVDPVRNPLQGPNVVRLPNVVAVVRVDAIGQGGGLTNGNAIAALGRAVGGGRTTVFDSAAITIAVDAPHAHFGSLFEGHGVEGLSASAIADDAGRTITQRLSGAGIQGSFRAVVEPGGIEPPTS